MTAVINFFKGLVCQPVSYATRYHSRAYSAGAITCGALIVTVPVFIVFSLGFLAGYVFGN